MIVCSYCVVIVLLHHGDLEDFIFSPWWKLGCPQQALRLCVCVYFDALLAALVFSQRTLVSTL